MCFQPPILLGAPCCAWGPKRGRRKILSGPCCESLAGLANSASPGCNGLNQTQISLEILCTTTSFTSEAKPHEPPPPLRPTPQGMTEHRSRLPLHTKPRVSDTPRCISQPGATPAVPCCFLPPFLPPSACPPLYSTQDRTGVSSRAGHARQEDPLH